MTDAGVLALSDSGRFDPARLRAERRDRVLAGMTEDRIDALLLGTAPNIRYATGARPLWLAGARAFAPLAVVLREGETHLVGASDDGVPPEVPSDHLVSSTWNPATLMRRLAAIDGLTSARTIGVDGLTPMFEQLLTSTFPRATLVDGTPPLWRARATKTEDELSCLRTASAVCEAALWDVVTTLAVGDAERDLQARFVERMASFGTTTPAFDGTFCVSVGDTLLRRFASPRNVAAGDMVALDVGVLFNGYEGGLARTWLPAGSSPTAAQAAAARPTRCSTSSARGCRPTTSPRWCPTRCCRWPTGSASASSRWPPRSAPPCASRSCTGVCSCGRPSSCAPTGRSCCPGSGSVSHDRRLSTRVSPRFRRSRRGVRGR